LQAIVSAWQSLDEAELARRFEKLRVEILPPSTPPGRI
jgi:hypothetical protein